MKNNYYIREYGVIRKCEDFQHEPGSFVSENEIYLPSAEFDSVLNFILDNQTSDGSTEPPFTIFRRNKHHQIKVKNYVGVIETKNGITIEILPKIHLKTLPDSIYRTRQIFLKMLRHLKDSPFKTINTAHLKAESNFPILEVFIRSFITECELLFSKGLKKDYLIEEGNLNVMKGKLIISENIKRNIVKRRNFYCSFTEFSQNIPQNRIVKSTLLKLIKKSRSHDNVTALLALNSRLETITESKDIQADLRSCFLGNRLFVNYKTLIMWCEIFLTGKSFTNFKGSSINTAVLFPMEKVFENYITSLFKKHATGFVVKTQDKSYFLVEQHIDAGKFKLIPDLFLQKDKTDRIIIDTKWKLINEQDRNHNYQISSADMYQLFAYGMKYSTKQRPRLILIYPINVNFSQKLEPFEYYKDDLILEVVPFDLTNNGDLEVNKILSYLLKKNGMIKNYPDNDMITLAAEDHH